MLAVCLSILLVRLLGAVITDNKLDRAMVGFTAAAGAGDFGFPVGGFLVESAEGLSTLRDGGPGFVSARNIGHEAAGGEGDLTALRGLSLGHPETADLLCRSCRLGERLRLSCRREAP